MVRAGSFSFETFNDAIPAIALQWFILTLAVVLGRVLYLVREHDFRTAMIWFVKLITDPFTDIFAYYGSVYRILQPQARKSEAA